MNGSTARRDMMNWRQVCEKPTRAFHSTMRVKNRNKLDIASFRAYTGLSVCLQILILTIPAIPAAGENRLSRYTDAVFCPDGDIKEFINANGDSQIYFETNPGVPNNNYGRVLTTANLANGVYVVLDRLPNGVQFAAGPTGFEDKPGLVGANQHPTGFNIGRVFASYNEELDAYFVAVDSSAPSALDTLFGSQPVAFDVDGDGNVNNVTEAPNSCFLSGLTELPANGNDEYYLDLDLNQDQSIDVRISLVETLQSQANEIPPNALLLSSSIPGEVIRYLEIRAFDAEILDLAKFTNKHLDSDNDGFADDCVVGVGADIEFMISNVSQGSELNDPFGSKNSAPSYTSFMVVANSATDLCLDGNADLVEIDVPFPVTRIDVKHSVRNLASNLGAASTIQAMVDDIIELAIDIEYSTNVDASIELLVEFDCSIPATASFVPNSCRFEDPIPPGINPLLLCAILEFEMQNQGVAELELDLTSNSCASAEEPIRMTYQVLLETTPGEAQLCQEFFECSGRSLVQGESELIDPLPDNQEENSSVNDEFRYFTNDWPGIIDTYQEELSGDDNEVFVDVACFPDCNFNVIDDTIELAAGSALDCNTNAIPDVCDIDANPGSDCNTNGVPDECEPDCNGDGIPDGCDSDCDASGVSDACEIAAGSSIDCNENRIPDHCDIGDLISPDCDSNGIPDDCQPDCNNNGVADACDIMSGTSEDCVSTNGAGGAVTGESDGIPDECEPAFPIDLITSTWVTTSGLWSVPRSWCPMIVPNNSGTSDFAVQIEGPEAVATLDISTALRQLVVSDQAVIQVDEVSPFLASLAVEDASSNGGTLQALNTTTNGDAGRILQLTIADLQQNSNGQLVADGPGTIVRLVESTVTGGSIQTRNGGVVELTGGSELVNVQVNGVVVPDGQVGFFAGTVENAGLFRIAPDGQFLAALSPAHSGGALAGDENGNGRARLGGQFVARLGDFKSSFCNTASHAIEGAGIIFGGVNNEGTIRANAPPEHLIIFPPGAKTNAGTMMASNGAVLRIESAIDQTSTGIIEAVTGGEVRILAPVTGNGVIQVSNPCGTGLLGCSTPILRIGSVVEANELLALEGGAVEMVGDANVNLSGTMEIDGGVYRGDSADPTLVTASLAAIGIRLVSDASGSGELHLSGGMQLVTAGTVQVAPCGSPFEANTLRGCSTPILVIEDDAEVSIGGEFRIEAVVDLTVTSSIPVALAGNLVNLSTNPADFDWLAGHLLLDGSTQGFEAAGENRGDTPAGFLDNFALGTLELGAGVTVKIVDDADNVTTSGVGCDEALYADTLILRPGSVLDAGGCSVYYNNLINNGGTILGHGTDVQNIPSADYNDDGQVDLVDYGEFAGCLDSESPEQTCLDRFDADHDLQLNLRDFAHLQSMFHLGS